MSDSSKQTFQNGEGFLSKFLSFFSKQNACRSDSQKNHHVQPTRSFIPYAKPSIDQEDIDSVTQALKSERITRGPLVEEFEQAIASYCDVPFVVAFNSGTAALHAAYFAAGLSQEDRVITSPNSFIATIGAPLQKEIYPTFVDIDSSSGGLNLDYVKEATTISRTRGKPILVPVHFSGIAHDMRKMEKQVSHPDTVVIEDAAHAIGSCYPSGEKVGCCAYSHMTIFSFHPAKTLTTGEGGAVTTYSQELAQRLKLFRDNGIRRIPYKPLEDYKGCYDVEAITGNFNVTSFQAALGLSQLKKIDIFIEKRRKLVAHYRQRLENVPAITFFSQRNEDHTAFHLFVVQIDFSACHTTRSKVMQQLHEKGIGTEVHYIPLYCHSALKEKRAHLPHCPQMEAYFQKTLTLPLYADLSINEVDFICDQLLKILKN